MKDTRNRISIGDRLEHGVLTVMEVCQLASRSRAGFYADVKKGLVEVRKIGRKTVIPGPVARGTYNARRASDDLACRLSKTVASALRTRTGTRYVSLKRRGLPKRWRAGNPLRN